MALPQWVSPRVRDLPRVGSRRVDETFDALSSAGRDVLSLHAHPKRPLPEHVLHAAASAATRLDTAPSRGLPSLRAAIADRLTAEWGQPVDPDRNVLVTAGAMQALDLAFGPLLEPGDEVVTPVPCFYLDGLLAQRGARLAPVDCRASSDYAVDWERFERAISARTRLLLLVTPGNPTGYVLSAADLDALAQIAERRNLLVLADESYDRIVYDGQRHLSPAAHPGLAARAAVIRSFTKSYAMPGWRVGYLVGPAPLIDASLKLLEWSTLYGSLVPQAAAEAALTGPQDWLADVTAEFQSHRDQLHQLFGKLGLPTVRPRGGPFLFPDVSAHGSSEDVARRLLEEYGIPAVPGRSFLGEGHIRLALGCSSSTLERLIQRLERAFAAEPLVSGVSVPRGSPLVGDPSPLRLE